MGPMLWGGQVTRGSETAIPLVKLSSFKSRQDQKVSHRYAPKRSKAGKCGFRPPQAPGLPLVYKTVTPPGGVQYVKIGSLS